MRGRLVTAVFILCVVVAAVWEGRKWISQPPAPPAAIQPPMPVVPPAPAPKKPLPSKPKTVAVPQKKVAPPIKVRPPQPVAPPVPVAPPTPLPVQLPPPPMPLEWRGNSDTSIKHSGQIVVKNDHQWIRFWSEHHPDEVAPDVDFSQNMVVGVFVGRRPADAFRVDITGVRITPDALVVDYYERAPPPGTFQVAVEVYPYDIKVVPRSALRVKFNEMKAQYQPSPYQRPAPSTTTVPGAK